MHELLFLFCCIVLIDVLLLIVVLVSSNAHQGKTCVLICSLNIVVCELWFKLFFLCEFCDEFSLLVLLILNATLLLTAQTSDI